MVCEGGLGLLCTWMRQVSELQRQHGIKVIWVTSGAIAWAAHKTNFARGQRTLPQKQALSAIGQPLVMDQYNLALTSAKLLGAQVLLTADDMKHRQRRDNLQNSLQQLLHWQVVPILNENDAVATEEIQFGDNDSLAAKVAVMMKVERLVLMTDVDGLFDANPKTHPKAKLFVFRKSVTSADLRLADDRPRSSFGTGGMRSKLLAARAAFRSGITTHLVRGDLPNNLLNIAKGDPLGTTIGNFDG